MRRVFLCNACVNLFTFLSTMKEVELGQVQQRSNFQKKKSEQSIKWTKSLFKHFQLSFDAGQHFYYMIALIIKVFLVLYTAVDNTVCNLNNYVSLSCQFEKHPLYFNSFCWVCVLSQCQFNSE